VEKARQHPAVMIFLTLKEQRVRNAIPQDVDFLTL